LRDVKTRKNYCVDFPSRLVRGRNTRSETIVFVAWCRIDNRWCEIVQADAEAQKFQDFETGVQVPNRAVPKGLTWAGNRVALM